MLPKDDLELFDLMRRQLFSAVIGDVLDTLGFRHQFLPPEIRPLHDDMLVVGRAMPVLEADFFVETAAMGGEAPSAAAADGRELSRKPFGLMFEALDDLKPGEVYLASGGSPRYALWGELMSTRALHLHAAGAVLNGYSRDTRGILRLGFPTFSWGRYAQDQGVRGKVVDYRVPLEVGGVRVAPGDIVFGDLDGVVIVPKDAASEAISRALDKVQRENKVRTAIEAGMSTREAFDTYGVM
jgi:4-hydroxy-4-methyl-2-oxoglutarate aldolase